MKNNNIRNRIKCDSSTAVLLEALSPPPATAQQKL